MPTTFEIVAKSFAFSANNSLLEKPFKNCSQSGLFLPECKLEYLPLAVMVL